MTTEASTCHRPRCSGTICAAITAFFVFGGAIAACAAPGRGAPIRVLLSTAQPVVVRAPDGATIRDGHGAVIASVNGEVEISFRSRGAGVSVALGGEDVEADQVEMIPGGAAGGGRFRLGGSSYRGALRVTRGQDGSLLAINVLSIEEYLYGVVGCEMPAGWPEEALKSQAVAARSFAMACQSGAVSRGLPYDLTATTDGQVYRGLDGEDPRTSGAVDSTRGVTLVSSGEPIRAVFHSSSGGHTENSEFVWSARLPYLKGVEDPDDDSPHRSWEFRATADEIEEALGNAGFDVGGFLGVQGLEAGVSGRWSTVVVRGSKGEAVLRGSEFRRALGLKSAWFTVTGECAGWKEALSRLNYGQAWVISATGEIRQSSRDSLSAGAAVLGYRFVPAGHLFQGRGYGHGVGLSQWGARALANRGYKYPDILQHYYLNTRLDGGDESVGVAPGQP